MSLKRLWIGFAAVILALRPAQVAAVEDGDALPTPKSGAAPARP